MLHLVIGRNIPLDDFAALGRYFGIVTHETLASGTRTLYHCQPGTR